MFFNTFHVKDFKLSFWLAVMGICVPGLKVELDHHFQLPETAFLESWLQELVQELYSGTRIWDSGTLNFLSKCLICHKHFKLCSNSKNPLDAETTG